MSFSHTLERLQLSAGRVMVFNQNTANRGSSLMVRAHNPDYATNFTFAVSTAPAYRNNTWAWALGPGATINSGTIAITFNRTNANGVLTTVRTAPITWNGTPATFAASVATALNAIGLPSTAVDVTVGSGSTSLTLTLIGSAGESVNSISSAFSGVGTGTLGEKALPSNTLQILPADDLLLTSAPAPTPKATVVFTPGYAFGDLPPDDAFSNVTANGLSSATNTVVPQGDGVYAFSTDSDSENFINAYLRVSCTAGNGILLYQPGAFGMSIKSLA